MAQPPASSPSAAAYGAGLSAYLIWGFIPLVFQLLGSLGMGSWEILAHRTFWAIPVAALFVWMAGQTHQALAVFRRPRVLALLALSALLIAVQLAMCSLFLARRFAIVASVKGWDRIMLWRMCSASAVSLASAGVLTLGVAALARAVG